MVSMRFNCRDLFQSVRIALGLQRLWLQSLGLFFAYAVYFVLTYAALGVSGVALGDYFTQYGLLPCVAGQQMSAIGWLLAVLGIAGALFMVMATAAAVSRATYMHLKGHLFYTWQEAWRFGLKTKAASLISAPLAVVVIIGAIVAGGTVIGLLGRIPVIGAVGLSVFTVIWYAAGLFLVFTALALGLSLVLTPAILASTDDDAFEGIFQSFSILHTQPWRFILYELLTALLALAGFIVMAFLAKLAWGVMNHVLVLGMGRQYGDLSYQATALVQNLIYPAVAYVKAMTGAMAGCFFFSQDFILRAMPMHMQIASWLTAVFMLFIGGVVLAFPVAIWNAGQTMIFIIIKKVKENDDVLLRSDREEEAEEVSAEPAGAEDAPPVSEVS